MKYSDEIMVQENEAHSMLLKKITPGSNILEFGCASGRMTRLLKEKLFCRVYIIEYEREAYEQAVVYADEGLCDDIENLSWKEKWSDQQFDYIIFADVLEHLRNPNLVLSETIELLKDSGEVLVSVPNIGHNDIWLKLYDNHFDYTDIGILDNTHLHFYSENNLYELEENTGYTICSMEYKTVPTFTTEQYRSYDKEINEELLLLLCQRKNGEIYQFVLVLKKSTFVCQNRIKKYISPDLKKRVQGTIYFDRGNGFQQEDCISVNAECYDNSDDYGFCIVLNLEEDIRRIRYDPLEGMPCIIKEYLAVGEDEIIQINMENIIEYKGMLCAYSNDPQLIFENLKSREVIIYFRFSISFQEICLFTNQILKEFHLNHLGNDINAGDLIKLEKKIQGRVYFDRGTGFHQEDGICVYARAEEFPKYVMHHSLDIGKDVIRVRYDPIEERFCLFKKYLAIMNQEIPLTIKKDHLIEYDDILFANTIDPQLIFECAGGGRLELYVEFIISK